MGFLSRINVYRRKITHGITKNIGSKQQANIPFDASAKIKRVLICRPNHRLGNLLLITPLVQEVSTLFPDATIDIFIKGNLGPIVFKNYSHVGHVISLPKKHFKEPMKYLGSWLKLKKHQYDLVINVDKNSSSGRLSAQLANAKYKFFGDAAEGLETPADYSHIAKYPVYNLRNYLRAQGFPISNSPVSQLDIKLNGSEIAQGKANLDSVVSNIKKTIGIFTFATGDKCYSEVWWDQFYNRLASEFSDYNIIEILPVENVSQIQFRAPTYYSKDIRQIAALIANIEVFIGADSGIMHLASSSQTPTVGLFSVSSLPKYEPYGNGNLAVDTNHPHYLAHCITAVNAILNSN